MPLLDAFYAWRNRVAADPKFQRWAASFPLTRPIAKSQARGLFDLCAGFVYSQVLYACIQLGVFKILAEGPQPLAALAPRLKLAPDRAARLLDAAASLKLLTRRRDGAYSLALRGAALLGNPGVAAMIAHHHLLYADLADPVALLRGEGGRAGLTSFWPYAKAEHPCALTPDAVAGYSALMASSQALIADDILDAYPMSGHSCLLDIGGGEGAFLAAAGKWNPNLRLQLFDLPAVAELARAHLAAQGLAARAVCAGGDFRSDSLPAGADLVSLVRIVHDHDDDAALALLRNIRRTLPAQGKLLIAEPLAETPGAEPIGDAYFGFYLLAMGSGKPRSFKEISRLLAAAGFSSSRQLATRRPMLTGLILAEPAQGYPQG